MDNNIDKLLPEGFCDLIGDEARINQEASNKIISTFQDSGYSIIKTPLLEFEQTFSSYQKVKSQSFHVPDISSGKNLVFRNDITVQIARLVNTRLKDAKLPLKLCYIGDVLKVDSHDLHPDRQLTQAGVELIGDSSQNAIRQVIDVTLKSLTSINVDDLTIEFCLPGFLDLLVAELKIDNDELVKAIAEKNISKIKELGGKYADQIANLALEIKDIKKIQDNLDELPVSNNLKKEISSLLEVVQGFKTQYPKIIVLVNIFSDLEFSYHQEIGFTVFAQDSFYPIARGGKYQINDKLPAVGSTIYVNNLRQILLK